MPVRCYDDLVSRMQRIARSPTVELEQIGEFEANSRTYPMYLMRMGNPAPDKVSVLINAGIHGDEPAGVEAALRFLETNSDNRDLLSRFSFVVFPCNNPTGWELDTRENWAGIDLNREFNTRKPPPEAAIISDALQGRCFDVVFEMHEDVDSPGLYLYEIAEDSSRFIGHEIISAAAALDCPINREECIEGMSARGGLIRRKAVRFRKTRLPLAIFVYRTCGGHVITLEPPASRLSFEKRVEIQLTALRILLDSAATNRRTSQS